jgi:hypothetical protein
MIFHKVVNEGESILDFFPSSMLGLFRSGDFLSKLCESALSSLSYAGSQTRGVKRVRQKRRTMGKLIQLKQSHYFPKPDDYTPIPKAVLGSGYVRRLLKAGTVDSLDLIPTVAWEKFMCTTEGVRWHPCGAWRVQFSRRNLEHNYHVGVDCYFYTKLHGFHRAKELAISYRKRLELEWEEAEDSWRKIDEERTKIRETARADRELVAALANPPKTGSPKITRDTL